MWVGSVKRELMENYTGGELRESRPMGIKKMVQYFTYLLKG